MFHYIYEITNKINGKRYIGKHSYKKLENSYFGSGHILKKAIQKHGKHNFIKNIIEVFDTSEDAYQAEKQLINQLDAVNSVLFYNAADGGMGGKFNRILSPEHKEKIGKARKGFHHTDEAKAKISASHRGKPSWHKGRKKSEDTKTKMSHAQRKLNKHMSEVQKRHLSDLNKGSRNPNYGKRWITNNKENMKVDANFPLPEGWHYGRIVSHIIGFRGA